MGLADRAAAGPARIRPRGLPNAGSPGNMTRAKRLRRWRRGGLYALDIQAAPRYSVIGSLVQRTAGWLKATRRLFGRRPRVVRAETPFPGEE